jgi:1,4-dihydroxy-2-naphthoate octaprenyltransferase
MGLIQKIVVLFLVVILVLIGIRLVLRTFSFLFGILGLVVLGAGVLYVYRSLRKN